MHTTFGLFACWSWSKKRIRDVFEYFTHINTQTVNGANLMWRWIFGMQRAFQMGSINGWLSVMAFYFRRQWFGGFVQKFFIILRIRRYGQGPCRNCCMDNDCVLWEHMTRPHLKLRVQNEGCLWANTNLINGIMFDEALLCFECLHVYIDSFIAIIVRKFILFLGTELSCLQTISL